MLFRSLFYSHREGYDRGSLSVDKTSIFLNSAYSVASAPLWNYGSIICGPIADFTAFILSVVLVRMELRKQKDFVFKSRADSVD